MMPPLVITSEIAGTIVKWRSVELGSVMEWEGATKIGRFFSAWKDEHPGLEKMLTNDEDVHYTRVERDNPMHFVTEWPVKNISQPMIYYKDGIFRQSFLADIMRVKETERHLFQLNLQSIGEDETVFFRLLLPTFEEVPDFGLRVEYVYGIDRVVTRMATKPMEAMIDG